MSYEILWRPRARRQVAALQAWWVENRAAALTTFQSELARIIRLLEHYPELGVLMQGLEIRRVLLPDTEQFVYYRVRRRVQRIEIIALWGARRELGPPLLRR